MDEKLRAMKLGLIQKICNEILGGHSDPIGLLKTWPMPKGPFLPGEENLNHALYHYAADADIREKDAAEDPSDTTYEEYQINEIRKWLAELYKVK